MLRDHEKVPSVLEKVTELHEEVVELSAKSFLRGGRGPRRRSSPSGGLWCLGSWGPCGSYSDPQGCFQCPLQGSRDP